MLKDFFNFQSEFLFSVNLITSPFFSWAPGTLWLTVIFCFIVCSFIILKFFLSNDRKKIISEYQLIGIFIICWTPLFINFIVNQYHAVAKDYTVYGSSYNDKFIWRYCNIDKTQDFGNYICQLPYFLNKIEETVPSGSSLVILSEPFYKVYLAYWLYPNYNIKEDYSEVDYIVVYRPLESVFLTTDDKLFILKNQEEELNEEINFFGYFDFDIFVSEDIFLLKRSR